MRQTVTDLLSVRLRKGARASREPREQGAPSHRHTDPQVSPEKRRASTKRAATRLLSVSQGSS